MNIQKALLIGITAAALAFTAACQDTPADTPGAPTRASLLRPEDWTIVTEGRPLHEAALAGNRADVEKALEEGANVNATAIVLNPWGFENGGLTPLHLAALLNDNPEVAALLLERGADIKAEDDGGGTPLHGAARSNENPEVAALLLDRGADVHAKDNFFCSTPLHGAAVSNDNPEVVALLLDRGADIEAKSAVGNTPLHVAAMGNENLELVALLLDRGADVHAKDDFSGNTPLHNAAWLNDNPEVAALLLERGADVHAKNDDDETPCELARGRAEFDGTQVLARLCTS